MATISPDNQAGRIEIGKMNSNKKLSPPKKPAINKKKKKQRNETSKFEFNKNRIESV